MRRLIALSAIFIFVFITAVIVTDKSSIMPTSTQTPKLVTVKTIKEPNVTLTGTVKETTNTTIVVDRIIKDKKETLEFALDKAVEKIKAGDKVKVSYIKKEGKYIAKRVVLIVPEMTTKKVTRAKVVKQEAH
ncbi:MAG TPA: hypothetical protein VFG29_13510 [Syntrophales bacterium]|nr:hypothetical protein [Syntrophales bacterium]